MFYKKYEFLKNSELTLNFYYEGVNFSIHFKKRGQIATLPKNVGEKFVKLGYLKPVERELLTEETPEVTETNIPEKVEETKSSESKEIIETTETTKTKSKKTTKKRKSKK